MTNFSNPEKTWPKKHLTPRQKRTTALEKIFQRLDAGKPLPPEFKIQILK